MLAPEHDGEKNLKHNLMRKIFSKTIFFLIINLLVISFSLSQNCGEVSTVVANDGRIVSDIAADKNGNIYISQSPFGSTVMRLTPDGDRETFIDDLQSAGGLEVDGNGNLYVSKFHTQEIKPYNSAGELLEKWESGLTGPAGLALDDEGNLYIAEYGELGGSEEVNTSGDRIGVIKKGESDTVQTLMRDDRLNATVDIEFDESGHFYTANGRDGKVFTYSNTGKLTVLAEAQDDIHFGWIVYLDETIYSTHFTGHTIYKTDIKSCTISVLAGTGSPGSLDGNLNKVSFNRPNGIESAHSGEGLFVTETNVNANVIRLRQITLCD